MRRRPGGSNRLLLVFTVFSGAILVGIWLATALVAVERRDETFRSAKHEILGAQRLLRAQTARTYELMQSTLAITDNWLKKNSGPAGTAGRSWTDCPVLSGIRPAFCARCPLSTDSVDHSGPLCNSPAHDHRRSR